MKTVRFASVIAQAGKPDHHLTWSDPAHDPALRTAAKATRLMTVHQQTRGTRKDFGVVGLEPGGNVQYFIFPRSLRRFAGARIVAIDYESTGERLSLAAQPPNKRAAPIRRTGKIIAFPGKADRQPSRIKTRKPAPPLKDPRPNPPSQPEIEKTISAALRDLRQRRSTAAATRLTKLLTAMRA